MLQKTLYSKALVIHGSLQQNHSQNTQEEINKAGMNRVTLCFELTFITGTYAKEFTTRPWEVFTVGVISCVTFYMGLRT